jgi:hypothetical protein
VTLDAVKLSNGGIKLSAPKATVMTIYSVRGEQLAVLRCDNSGACTLNAADFAATTLIVEAATSRGPVKDKLALGN